MIKVNFAEEHKKRAQDRRSERNRDGVLKFFLFAVPTIILGAVIVLAIATLLALR